MASQASGHEPLNTPPSTHNTSEPDAAAVVGYTFLGIVVLLGICAAFGRAIFMVQRREDRRESAEAKGKTTPDASSTGALEGNYEGPSSSTASTRQIGDDGELRDGDGVGLKVDGAETSSTAGAVQSSLDNGESDTIAGSVVVSQVGEANYEMQSLSRGLACGEQQGREEVVERSRSGGSDANDDLTSEGGDGDAVMSGRKSDGIGPDEDEEGSATETDVHHQKSKVVVESKPVIGGNPRNNYLGEGIPRTLDLIDWVKQRTGWAGRRRGRRRMSDVETQQVDGQRESWS